MHQHDGKRNVWRMKEMGHDVKQNTLFMKHGEMLWVDMYACPVSCAGGIRSLMFIDDAYYSYDPTTDCYVAIITFRHW